MKGMKGMAQDFLAGTGIKMIQTKEFTVVISDNIVTVMANGWTYTPLNGVVKFPKKGIAKCSEGTLRRIASAAVRDYKRFKKESLGNQEFPTVVFN